MNSINPYLIRHFWILLITIRRNRSGKGKERLFPREIIDDRTRNTNTTAVRSPANEGCEASKGEERFEPHNTSPAMLVDPRYSIETEHYSFIVSPLHRVQFLLDSARGFRRQLRHLQRAFRRHVNTKRFRFDFTCVKRSRGNREFVFLIIHFNMYKIIIEIFISIFRYLL